MLKGPPVEAVVLDMDGVLIDTEPVWRAAQSDVFAGFGVALSEGDLLLDRAADRGADTGVAAAVGSW